MAAAIGLCLAVTAKGASRSGRSHMCSSQADMDRVVCKYSLDALLHVVFAVRSALGALTYVAGNIRCSDAWR